MRFCFVSTRRGSRFMTELLVALSDACAEAGHRVELAFDAFPSLDSEPLIPGEHFLVADVDEIATAVDELLDDPARLLELRHRAYDFVRRELSMRPAAERLAELAAELPPC